MTTNPNQILKRIDFGNEAGDDVQPSEVLNFFVEQSSFEKFLNPTKSILLATAKKGVGKSALIRWIEAKIQEEHGDDVIVISCKGSDLVRSNFKLSSELKLPNDYIRDWMVRICALVNRHIGAELNLALRDDAITLVESAELDGFKSRNLVSALTDRLRKLIPQQATVEKLHATNEIELLKRFDGKKVWFLVDDLDATYQRTPHENLELSTFFSACRYLAAQVTGINFRITMRTDVWPLIRRFDESLDKFEQYVHDITWSQADFRTLLYKRIRYQMNSLKIEISLLPVYSTEIEIEEHYVNQIFETRTLWNNNERPMYQIIYTLSYHRPRWAIQLCKFAQEEAIREKQGLITKQHIDAVWGEYGRKRISDLIAEHKHQCRDVEELINGFRGAERRMTRDELILWITNHITNHLSPVIEGKPVKSPLDIAHFLFRLGFVVARAEKEDQGYEHYFFADMPDFLSSRTNQDFGIIWEIHPCYRQALDIQKLNQYQQKRRNYAR
ncbi:MAG: hypothetical protein V7L20_01955 [Nostoc sp.]|uniref:P-loop ATPase, Sll1717 family n=1 Tax=Nostoc sp. TaxID=1180 RepID=UPI002FF6BC36